MADGLVEFFGSFPARMTPERLGTWQASVVLEITGEGGGTWLIRIADGKMIVTSGNDVPVDTTISVSAADFQQIIAARLNPQLAFMTGKLKVKGAMGNALKLSSLLSSK